MTSDGLHYNAFNLPSVLSPNGDGEAVSNVYRTDGTIFKRFTADQTRYYLHGLIIEDGAIKSYEHANGRVTFGEDEQPHFQYRLADHLGNTVVLFEDRDEDGIISSSLADPATAEVLQRELYYPFGLPLRGTAPLAPEPSQDYLYNGKEDVWESGLLAYGFRMYDPTVGRFTGVDPIAGEFAWVSPYNYAENEPLAHIDLHGLQKAEVLISGLVTSVDKNTNNTNSSQFALGLVIDIGSGNKINFGVSVDGLAIGGEYSPSKGVSVGIQDATFAGSVAYGIRSAETEGWGIPDRFASSALRDAAKSIRGQMSDENTDLFNNSLNAAANTVDLLAADVESGVVGIRWSKDGTTDVATRSDGSNYIRKMTNSFAITPEGNLNVQVSENSSFEGRASVRYTQEKCVSGCND